MEFRTDDLRLDSRRARLLASCERFDVATPTAAPDRELANALLAAAGFDPRTFAARSDDYVAAYVSAESGVVQSRLTARHDAGDPEQDPDLIAARAETAKARQAMIDRQAAAWQTPSKEKP
jgi:hypothetical protein